jgi:lipopolysaccharide export system permease protein
MLSVRQLSKTIDSLRNNEAYFLNRSGNDISPYFTFVRYSDTGLVNVDTKKLGTITSIKQIIPDSARSITAERALNQVNAVKSTVEMLANDYNSKQEEIRYNLIEWHRKFTLSVACIVLFLIGAPLGSIIRKGGLGTPLVFAVIFFVVFHLLNTFGEKFVKGAVLSPFAGMWMSSALLIPIGFFLTYKAMQDSQLFNQEYYYRSFRKFRIIINNFRNKKAQSLN